MWFGKTHEGHNLAYTALVRFNGSSCPTYQVTNSQSMARVSVFFDAHKDCHWLPYRDPPYLLVLMNFCHCSQKLSLSPKSHQQWKETRESFLLSLTTWNMWQRTRYLLSSSTQALIVLSTRCTSNWWTQPRLTSKTVLVALRWLGPSWARLMTLMYDPSFSTEDAPTSLPSTDLRWPEEHVPALLGSLFQVCLSSSTMITDWAMTKFGLFVLTCLGWESKQRGFIDYPDVTFSLSNLIRGKGHRLNTKILTHKSLHSSMFNSPPNL